MSSRKIPPKNALSKNMVNLLKVNRLSNEFKIIKRMIWTKGLTRRECNGEHTNQLGFIAWFLRDLIAPHLSYEKISKYVNVHDLPEVYAGETPAFQDKTGTHKSPFTHLDKKARETKAIERLEREFPFFPSMIETLYAYEAQADEESRFVYALDKLISEVNIYQDRGRTDKKLRVTLDEKTEYKRAKIAQHAKILELHDELFSYMRAYRHDAQYIPKSTRLKESV